MGRCTETCAEPECERLCTGQEGVILDPRERHACAYHDFLQPDVAEPGVSP